MNPEYVIGYFARGAAYFNKKMYDQALADFSKAIELVPDNAVFYFARGATYMAQKVLFKEVATDMSKAIELNPVYADAYYVRGGAYAYMKSCDQAEKDFRKACELGNPRSCSAQCSQPEKD